MFLRKVVSALCAPAVALAVAAQLHKTPIPNVASADADDVASSKTQNGSTSNTSKSPNGDSVKSLNDIVYSHLLRDRFIVLNGKIDDKLAAAVCAQLLYLNKQNNSDPITVFINSGGGKVHSAIAIIDTMNMISAPVHTSCFGRAESAAAIILGAGEKGSRCVSENSRVMIHQPSHSYESVKLHAREQQVSASELLRTKDKLERLVLEYTGNHSGVVRKAFEVDTYMTAHEAIEFGLVDHVCGQSKPQKNIPSDEANTNPTDNTANN